MEEEIKENIESSIRKIYGGYISNNILNKVISELEENSEFIKNTTKVIIGKKLNKSDKKAWLYKLSKNDFVKYLNEETLKEFLFELPEEKIKNIKAGQIPKKFFKKIIEDNSIDFNKKQKILGSLDYKGFTFSNFIENKEIIEKLILEIISYNKLKNIEADKIRDFLEFIIENVKNNPNEEEKQKNIERLKKIDYNNGYIFENFENKENIKYLLENLSENKIKLISVKYIPFEIFKELWNKANGKKGNQELKKILNLMDYKDFFYNIYELEDAKFILENVITDDELKYSNIMNLIADYDVYKGKFIINNEIKTLINDDFFINKIGLFNYNILYIKDILSKLGEYEEETLIKFLSHLSKENLQKFLPNIKDEKIIEEVILKTNETIPFNAVEPKLFRELLLESDDNILNKIKSFDYSIDYDIEKALFNNKNISEQNKKMAEKFLSTIGEEKIKTFSNKNISILLENKNFKDLIDDDLKQNLKEILVLRSFESNFKDFDVVTKSISSEEFLEIFLEYAESKTKEEINKIDLSDYKYNDEINKEIIQKILKQSPEKLPKFNIELFSNEELYSLIKEEKIKSENISITQESKLSFLDSNDKFNIVQEIIQNNNLFLENGELNIKTLEKLSKFMTESEISSFTEFYCENKRIEFNEEKLKESLKGFDIESDLTRLVHNNYSKRNKYLGKKGNENGYLLNRQENLYSLLKTLKNKSKKRLARLEQLENNDNNLEEIKNIKRELEENIEQLTIHIRQLKKYRDKNKMVSLCEKKEEKEILNFLTKQYCNEVLRRTLIDYHRRIKPFVDKYFKGESEEITKRIENSLGILFNYKSLNFDKLKAQKQLKKYLDIIGDKYKETIGEKFVSGEYVMLSSICAANNLNDLNLALYSYINDRITNDQLSQKTIMDANSGISDSVFYRGFNTTNRKGKKDIINDFMINPIARSGRVNYTNWDMTNDKSIINSHCSSEGGESIVGSYTSFSVDAKVSMGITPPMGFNERVYYGSSFSCVYCIPENLRKQFFNTVDILSEVNGYNVPIEYRIFTIVFKNSNSIPPSNDIEDVKFCEKMDFVTFKLKKDYEFDGITYKQNQLITQDQLKNIIKSIGRNKLPEFLHNCLSIERSFDKFKVLGGEEERIHKNEQKMLKTLEIEKRLKNIRNSLIKKEEISFPIRISSEFGSTTLEICYIKNIDDLSENIENTNFIDSDNIDSLSEIMVFFSKDENIEKYKKCLEIFVEEIKGFNIINKKHLLSEEYNEKFKELAEKKGIKNFDIDIANSSIDELYGKLSQIAGVEIGMEEDKDLGGNNIRAKNGDLNKDIIIEEEEEDKDLDEIAQELSNGLNELDNKKEIEINNIEEEEIEVDDIEEEIDLNSIETPKEAYDKIIKPVLEGIDNIKIDNNSITAVLNVNAEHFSSTYKTILRKNLKNLIDKLPEENREKLKDTLLKEGVKEKLNEMSKSSGIKLGNLLLNNLNKENNISK